MGVVFFSVDSLYKDCTFVIFNSIDKLLHNNILIPTGEAMTITSFKVNEKKRV
jgi:hypothetical protein